MSMAGLCQNHSQAREEWVWEVGGEVDGARAGYVVAHFFIHRDDYFWTAVASVRIFFIKKTTRSERKEDFNGRTVPES